MPLPTHQDIYRSVLSHVASQVSPIPVLVEAAPEDTKGLSTWFDADVTYLEPHQNQRNEDFTGRGTVRLRGYWRSGQGKPSIPGSPSPEPVDHKLTLSQAAQNALRGANVSIYDKASGSGATRLGAALFSEAPWSSLEPVDGKGTILVDAEFLFSD